MRRMIETRNAKAREIIAGKLHDLLDAAEWGAKKRFADRCGVPANLVTRWLKGDTNIDAGTIDTIAEATGMTHSDLFSEFAKIPPDCIFPD